VRSLPSHGASMSWAMPIDNIGDYGRQYLLRALVAEKALAATCLQMLSTGYAASDGNDQPLKGTHGYKLHFTPEERQRSRYHSSTPTPCGP
jgi:hypothetical protein